MAVGDERSELKILELATREIGVGARAQRSIDDLLSPDDVLSPDTTREGNFALVIESVIPQGRVDVDTAGRVNDVAKVPAAYFFVTGRAVESQVWVAARRHEGTVFPVDETLEVSVRGVTREETELKRTMGRTQWVAMIIAKYEVGVRAILHGFARR
ncbi:hypothetical protein MVAC_28533 [Mycolicibacterium vaccae ATCC 25954]|uniref:Uncharacterized protein n=1 Tax=Mycolicibacterium vaccae ATCC 25954 TaxID=1194972 RepID=K0V0K3_MYCVA|nr:hypothetical protein MVAC_28533 [Mycolicibacterium vaccae ATCC 25954]